VPVRPLNGEGLGVRVHLNATRIGNVHEGEATEREEIKAPNKNAGPLEGSGV
jgi:hypothetical protein